RASFRIPALHDEVVSLHVPESLKMLKEDVLDSQVRDRDEADPPDLPGVLGLGGERLNEEDEGKRRSERSANARHAAIDAGRLSTAVILFRPSILRKQPRMLPSSEATTLPSSIRSAQACQPADDRDRPSVNDHRSGRSRRRNQWVRRVAQESPMDGRVANSARRRLPVMPWKAWGAAGAMAGAAF